MRLPSKNSIFFWLILLGVVSLTSLNIKYVLEGCGESAKSESELSDEVKNRVIKELIKARIQCEKETGEECGVLLIPKSAVKDGAWLRLKYSKGIKL